MTDPVVDRDELREVDVPLWSRDQCEDRYHRFVTERMLCAGEPAGGKDACEVRAKSGASPDS